MSIILSPRWNSIEGSLFRGLSDVLEEELTDKHKQLAAILEVARIEEHVSVPIRCWFGRPPHDLRCIARAFIAKAVFHFQTTEALAEGLHTDANLRMLCGWKTRGAVPSLATFSRAFATFSQGSLGDVAHREMVSKEVGDAVVMHVCRDSTAIVARERAVKKEKLPKVKKKRGRPRNDEVRPEPDPKRLDVQLEQSVEEALRDLPKDCNWGSKADTGGHWYSWKGWKAHIDWTDDNIPVNVVTTSASVHDSQVAVPMIKQTSSQICYLYELMDSAYDAPQIRATSADQGHVAIIDPNPRRGGVPEEKIFDPATSQRYKIRSTAERGNSRLKDEFGLRCLRVRGHAKAHLHIMFAIIALFADQILKPTSG